MRYELNQFQVDFLKMHLKELKACAGMAELCTEYLTKSCDRCWDNWFEDKKMKEESKKSPYLS